MLLKVVEAQYRCLIVSKGSPKAEIKMATYRRRWEGWPQVRTQEVCERRGCVFWMETWMLRRRVEMKGSMD